MLEIAYPLAFLALPLPLLVWRFLPPHRERVSALRVPFFSAIVQAAGVEARSGAIVLRRQRIQIVAAGVVWAAIISGLAKPQWVGEPIVRVEAARDIMLALDLSGSMDYRDFPGVDGRSVTRFQAVQQVVGRFVADRDSDRVGLIIFGDRAYLQLPFTRDLRTAAALVSLMDVGMAGPRTALGDAIGLSIHAFESSEVEDRILVLLTDGSDTASRMTPINAADIARQNGVTIYTIGIGSEEAAGEDRVDFTTLEAVASRSGGRFFRAEDQTALAAIYDDIDELSRAEVRTRSWRPRDSMVHWPAIAALGALLVACALLLYPGRRGTSMP